MLATFNTRTARRNAIRLTFAVALTISASCLGGVSVLPVALVLSYAVATAVV